VGDLHGGRTVVVVMRAGEQVGNISRDLVELARRLERVLKVELTVLYLDSSPATEVEPGLVLEELLALDVCAARAHVLALGDDRLVCGFLLGAVRCLTPGVRDVADGLGALRRPLALAVEWGRYESRKAWGDLELDYAMALAERAGMVALVTLANFPTSALADRLARRLSGVDLEVLECVWRDRAWMPLDRVLNVVESLGLVAAGQA
jgi:hypothetical protein